MNGLIIITCAATAIVAAGAIATLARSLPNGRHARARAFDRHYLRARAARIRWGR